jgi:hypothetical protein
MNRKKVLVAWTLLAATLMGNVGCYQTWMGGMTLPSAHYLKDRAEYFTPIPDFPLPRELATMQRQASEAGYYEAPSGRALGGAGAPTPPPGAAPAPPPPPAPAPGVPGVQPPPGGMGGARAPG